MVKGKKEEPTKLILERLTESQIKNMGGSRFIRLKWKTWVAAFVLSVGFCLIYGTFYRQSVNTEIISIAPLVVVVVGFIYTMIKAGNKFWDSIKDKDEPVEIK